MTIFKINQEINNVENGYKMTVVGETKVSYKIRCKYICDFTGSKLDVVQTHSKNKCEKYLQTGQWKIK